MRSLTLFAGANASERNITEILKAHNTHFFAQPKLQLTGQTSKRMRFLMSESTAPLPNRDSIEKAVQEFGWVEGPWQNEKLDFGAFYMGQMCRETSHVDWAKLFTATGPSQKSSIDWNHSKHSLGQYPDPVSFCKMVQRFVVAHGVATHIFEAAGVPEAMVNEFIEGVSEGMHHASLDELLKVSPSSRESVCRFKRPEARVIPHHTRGLSRIQKSCRGLSCTSDSS